MSPDDLLTHWKTQSAAADALGRNRQTVNMWFKSKRIPLDAQIDAEVASGGKLKADVTDEERAVLAAGKTAAA